MSGANMQILDSNDNYRLDPDANDLQKPRKNMDFSLHLDSNCTSCSNASAVHTGNGDIEIPAPNDKETGIEQYGTLKCKELKKKGTRE
jgi:hypothetical protein